MKKELAIIRILVYNVRGESPKRTKPNQPNEHDQKHHSSPHRLLQLTVSPVLQLRRPIRMPRRVRVLARRNNRHESVSELPRMVRSLRTEQSVLFLFTIYISIHYFQKNVSHKRGNRHNKTQQNTNVYIVKRIYSVGNQHLSKFHKETYPETHTHTAGSKLLSSFT